MLGHIMRLHRITDNMEGTAATPKMVILTRKIKIKGVCARTRSLALRRQTVIKSQLIRTLTRVFCTLLKVGDTVQQNSGIFHCNMSIKLFRWLKNAFRLDVSMVSTVKACKLHLVTAEIKLGGGARAGTDTGALLITIFS